MAQDFNLVEDTAEFDAFPPFDTVNHSDGVKEMVAVLHSARTGQSLDDIRGKVNALGEDFLKAGSVLSVNQGIEDEFRNKAETAIETNSLPDLLDAEIARVEQKTDIEDHPAPEIVDILQFKAGELYDRAARSALSRRVGTMKALDKRIENTSVSTFSIIGDVLDLIASAPLDGLTLAGFKRVEVAEELRVLLTNTQISDQEYYATLEEKLDELADAGWFTDENYLFLSAGVANIAEGGVGVTATLERVGGVLDLGFGVSSVAKLGLKTAPALIGRLRNTTRIAATTDGPEAVAGVLRNGAARPGDPAAVAAGVAEETIPNVTRLPRTDIAPTEFASVAPGAKIAAEMAQNNRILNIINELPFSRTIDPALISAWIPTGLRRLNEQIAVRNQNRVRNLTVGVDNRSNLFGTISFGKANGDPFSDINAAKRVAAAENGAVEEVVYGGNVFYEVHVEKNLSGKGLAATLDVNEIGTSFLREYGGTFLALPRRLDALAKRGEGVLTNVSRKIGPIIEQALKKTSNEDRILVEKIFYDLRDGERHASRRHPFNLSEFRDEWARFSDDPTAVPSAAAEELYFTVQELNDALYFVKADPIFKSVVDEGGEVLKFSRARQSGEIDEFSVIVGRSERVDVPEDELVLNIISGEKKLVADLPRGEHVFRVLQGGFENGETTARYLSTANPNIRRVSHSDVLGYNPGGPRGYSALNFFVKQTTEVLLDNGKKLVGKARTFLGTATRKEAQFAVDQLNAMLLGFRELVPNLTGLSKARAIDAVRALRADPRALALVRTNNAWNNNVNTVDDLVDFMTGQKLDPRKNVSFAARDDLLPTVDDTGERIFGSREGVTHGDDFEASINLPRNNGPRGDEPLRGFGGGLAETISPLDMIQNDFMRVTHSKAFEAYGFQSITGWLAGAKNLISNDVRGLTPLQAMRKATLADPTGPQSRSYEAARTAILRTLKNKSEYELKWNSMVNRVGEYVYDKGWKKAGASLFGNSIAKTPLEFIRGITFDARLGMLDPAQLIVQASQTWNILGIIGPLRGGEWLQSAVTHIPLRMAMKTDDLTIIKDIGRRASAFTGMDADEFVELATWVKNSGRLNVGDEIAEISGTSTVLAQGMARKVRGASRTFFNEGEKMPRSAAISTAWKEFKKQFPKLSPFDEFGVNWITARQDALTAAMTGSSAAAWQKGPLSVPLQFMTYSSRMMESIFTDRLLTNAERIRLATSQVAFWGAAGLGIGSFLDSYIIEDGLQMDETTYTLLRYGALDAFLNATLGTQAVFGGRLAMAEGFSQLLENFTDSNFAEVIGGPAGGLTKDASFALWQGMVDITQGNADVVQADLKKFVRNFTGPNKAYNAWVMFTTGDYLSRNDDVLVSGLTSTDSLLHLFGGQIRDANLAFTRIQVMANQDEMLKTHQKEIGRLVRIMTNLVEEGDMEGAREVQKQIALANAILPVWQRQKLKKVLYPQLDSFASSLARKGTIERFQGGLTGARGE